MCLYENIFSTALCTTALTAFSAGNAFSSSIRVLLYAGPQEQYLLPQSTRAKWPSLVLQFLAHCGRVPQIMGPGIRYPRSLQYKWGTGLFSAIFLWISIKGS